MSRVDVIAKILEEKTGKKSSQFIEKINIVINAERKILKYPDDIIADAIMKAMSPDDSLKDIGDIYFELKDGYIGVGFNQNYMQKSAYRSGAIRLIDSILIFENDNLQVTDLGVKYDFNPFSKDRGDFAGCMVKLVLSNGETKYNFVSKEHIDNARDMSNSDSWDKWYFEMAKKVAIKNTLKSIDTSVAFSEMIKIDNEEYSFDRKKAKTRDTRKFESILNDNNKIIEHIESVLNDMDISYIFTNGSIEIDIEESSDKDINTIKDVAKFKKRKNNDNKIYCPILNLKDI